MTNSILSDACSLLQVFEHSPWNELHVRTEDMEIYISRTREGCNPMKMASGCDAEQQPDGGKSPQLIKAMHLGSFKNNSAKGQAVAAGDTLGWLEVLDDVRPVLASATGVVATILCEEGDFVEHRTPLFEIMGS
ncbi:MAG: biotin/lipoyl-containing protein [Porticoccaceae bacterium]